MANNTSQTEQRHTSIAMETSGVKSWCATFAAEAVVVAIGNLFIITVFAKTSDLLRQHRHHFLMNLAVADFLVGALAEPLFVYILGGYYNLWSFEYQNIFFTASIFLDMFSGISSIAFLAAIAVERLYATLYPAKYRATKDMNYAVATCLLWAVCAVIPSIRIYLGHDYNSLYAWMPFVCLLLFVIGLAYTIIWAKVLFFSSKRLNQSRERRLNVTVTILTLSSLSTWLPFIILNTVSMFRPVSIAAIYSTKVLHYGNSLVNPFLFALKMPKFRQAAKSIFCSFRRNHGYQAPLMKREISSTKSLESSSSQNRRRDLEPKCTAVWLLSNKPCRRASIEGKAQLSDVKPKR